MNREVWWLVALEASMFFSLILWEFPHKWTMYLDNPPQFAVALGLAALLAVGICHVGPALFSTRFSDRRFSYTWVLLVWIGAGYVDFLVSLVNAQLHLHHFIHARWPGLTLDIVFAVLVVVLGVGLKSWWRGATAMGLIVGVGILGVSLTVNWEGVWMSDKYLDTTSNIYSVNFFVPTAVIKDVLFLAAPCFIAALRIGRIESRPSMIWLSGLVAIGLPLLLSVALADLATSAGVNLHYQPSLPRDFGWALCGHDKLLGPALWSLASLTMLSPSVLCLYSLLAMTGQFENSATRRFILASILVLTLCAACVSFPQYSFDTQIHQAWAWSIVGMGILGFLSALIVRTTRTSA